MLDAKKFGLALGLLMGISMIVLGMFAKHAGWGTEAVILISSVYKGYGPTVVGSAIGGIWGFVEGFFGGYIFVWLYNSL